MEQSPQDDARLDPVAADAEEVDAVPVLAETGTTLEPTRAAGQVVVRQAAAVAATSFAAGVATVALARATKVRRARRRARRAMPPIVASRSFLVDVHLLGPRD
jgi:xanthine/uracil permease